MTHCHTNANGKHEQQDVGVGKWNDGHGQL